MATNDASGPQRWYLNVPQLDRPIKRRRDEVRREIDGAERGVAVDARDWPVVTFVNVVDPRLAVRQKVGLHRYGKRRLYDELRRFTP